MLNESPVPGNKAQQPCCAKLVYRAMQFLTQAKPPSCQYTVGARIGSLGKGSQRKTLGSLGPRVPRPPLRASPFRGALVLLVLAFLAFPVLSAVGDPS